jgi:hypothetical protein
MIITKSIDNTIVYISNADESANHTVVALPMKSFCKDERRELKKIFNGEKDAVDLKSIMWAYERSRRYPPR